MLSKLSVKKPLTIAVAVVLALILGVMSFGNMTTDLLPSMELPYVAVFTTYPGASPEKVEGTVTKPMEQVLSATGGVQGVTSVSRENSSMILLEFAEGTNMDSAMIELNSKVNLIKGSLSDEVGTPMLMKLDPDMLPVVVASVDVDGMDVKEVSDYTSETLIPAFERISGVASVNATGLVERQLRVVLDQGKIDDLNQRILRSIDEKLADAQEELDANRKKLEDGRRQLTAGQESASQEIAQGQSELDEKKNQVTSGATLVQTTRQQLQSTLDGLLEQKQSLLELIEARQELEGQLKENADAQAQVTRQIEQQNAQAQQAGEKSAQLTQEIESLQGQIDALPEGDPGVEPLQEQQEQLRREKARQDALYTSAQQQIQALGSQLGQLKLIEQQLKAAMSPLEQLTQALGVDTTQALRELLSTLEGSITACQEALAKIDEEQSGLEAAQQALKDAQTQLEKGKMTLTLTSVQTAVGLSQGEAQLASAQQELDSAKEAAYEKAGIGDMLTQANISSILTAQNFSMPAGALSQDGMDYTVKVGEAFTAQEELENLTLFSIDTGDIGEVKLRDVASVEMGDNAGDLYAKINGNDGVLLSFQKQSTASTATVSHDIKDVIESLSQSNSKLHITALSDQGMYIDMIIQSVLENLLLGGILAVIILFLFLRSIRPTITVAFSIPLSLVIAVVLMYFSGVTLNIISLSGLALGVGMLVDNSIVVIENIYRLRQEGMDRFAAAVYGAKQVSGAIFASTLTTVCVFLPIVFTQGISRQLFTDMGLTIAYSLLASLVVALTLVPAMSSRLLTKPARAPGKGFRALLRGYETALRFTLRHKLAVCLCALGLFCFSVVSIFWMGTAFIPSTQTTQMTATIEMPRDTTTQERREMTDAVLQKIQAIEDVQTVGAMEGGAGSVMMGSIGASASSGSADSSSYMLYLVLREDKTLTNAQIANRILEDTKGMDCTVEVSESSMDMSAMGGQGIQVILKGEDLDVLQNTAASIAQVLQGIEGTEKVDDGRETADRELRVTVRKNEAMEKGLTVAQVYQQVAARLKTQVNSTTVTIQGEDYPVLVASSQEALTPDTLGGMLLTGTQNQEEISVKLEDVADISEGTTPGSISHEEQARTYSVNAEVADGYNIGLVSREVQNQLKDYPLPEGVTMELAGENETINQSLSDLVMMVVVAVAFIYLIMVAQFQSLLSPFIVMFTIPLAFTGGLLALQITGFELSVISMLGFLVLAGIVVNNGIVFVDYANQLRLHGTERRQALIETGLARIRPILMTALTTIFGLSTMALGMGMGADMVQPLAIVVIGGLTYATLLTLFVVPCLYDWLQSREPKKIKLPSLKNPDDDE